MDDQKKEITAAVAARIKYFRHVRNLSQEDLALRANINPAYFGQVERGLKCPTIDTLYKISQALEVPLPELLRTDALPSNTEERDQEIKELLARVPTDKLTQICKVIEDIVDLL